MRILTAKGRGLLVIGLVIGLIMLVSGLWAFLRPFPCAVSPELPYTVKLMTVRAYCPCEVCCGRWADGYTANGREIKSGDKFVAADPAIPFRTLVHVPGYSHTLVPVRDRGATVKGDRLEVFFHTHQEALEWGVKELEVKIERW